jgi:Fur family ferric uptake transcriptional regulator
MPNPGIQDSLLDLIDHSGLHLDAESLYQPAKEKDPRLNRVTVYRSLKLFKEGGLVAELDLMHHSGDQIGMRCVKIEEYFGEPLQEMRHCGALRAQDGAAGAH